MSKRVLIKILLLNFEQKDFFSFLNILKILECGPRWRNPNYLIYNFYGMAQERLNCLIKKIFNINLTETKVSKIESIKPNNSSDSF